MTNIADANPYPWPYGGTIDAAATVLLVCGAQHGLRAIAPGSDAALTTIDRVAARLRPLGVIVVWLRHGTSVPGRSPALPIAATPGWALAATPADDDLVVDAAGWDGCYGSVLDHQLRAHGRTHVLLVGLASEITVDTTVRTLNDQGYECLVVTDACAPVDADLGARAFASLTMSGGIFGALATSAQLDAALTASLTTQETP